MVFIGGKPRKIAFDASDGERVVWATGGVWFWQWGRMFWGLFCFFMYVCNSW